MPTASHADVARAQRILIYGVTGSGKSTAAERLGSKLGLPVHLVDDEIGWLPGWINRPVDEQIEIATRLVAADRWILDSAYSTWRDVVMERAQVMVGLDYPRWLSLAWLIRRTLRRVIDQQEVCNGNREDWTAVFGADSIIAWHFHSFANKRERIRRWEQAPTGLPVLRLTHPRQLAELLRSL